MRDSGDLADSCRLITTQMRAPRSPRNQNVHNIMYRFSGCGGTASPYPLLQCSDFFYVTAQILLPGQAAPCVTRRIVGAAATSGPPLAIRTWTRGSPTPFGELHRGSTNCTGDWGTTPGIGHALDAVELHSGSSSQARSRGRHPSDPEPREQKCQGCQAGRGSLSIGVIEAAGPLADTGDFGPRGVQKVGAGVEEAREVS